MTLFPGRFIFQLLVWGSLIAIGGSFFYQIYMYIQERKEDR